MSDAFNPYHKWLGIPLKHRPADHYRLLGVAQFESNEDVIAMAADQRMAFLRSFQAGERSKQVDKLLNEVAAAKACLPNKKKSAIGCCLLVGLLLLVQNAARACEDFSQSQWCRLQSAISQVAEPKELEPSVPEPSVPGPGVPEPAVTEAKTIFTGNPFSNPFSQIIADSPIRSGLRHQPRFAFQIQRNALR